MIYQIPKYDNIEGITEYLKDVTGLNKLKFERKEAGYNRRERLNEFIILGRWYTDSIGNFGKILNKSGGIIPAEAISRCPVVSTYKDLINKISENESICTGVNSHIPPDYVKCIICERPWTIKDVHDCISSSKTEVVDANPFVGALLSNINRLPQYIDIAPHHVSHESVRPLNLTQGYENVDKNYIIKSGDKIFVNVWSYSHVECDKLNTIQYSINDITDIINNTKLLGEFKLIAMKNGYDSDHNDPWFRIEFKNSTGSHEITIGWRRSVINIDWSKSNKDLLSLFENEDVTKADSFIHAHSRKKATEYLTKIIQAL